MLLTSLSRALRLFALAGLLAACDDAQALTSYGFRLAAESDPGEPLAGVQLRQAAKLVAQSGSDGVATFALAGQEGQHAALSVVCPPETTANEPELSTTLRSYSGGRTPELLARCTPNLRELVVVAMFENGAQLPIQHHLKTLAVTDDDGVAHFVLRGKPGETFELTVDTQDQPGLRPANPGASLTIGGRDDAQVLERTFILPVQKARPRARGPLLPKKIH